jgi:hypothetical protein
MNSDYVLFWWQRGEFSEQIGDFQATSCIEIPGADLLQDTSSETALQNTPLGEPRTAFDVRCVYDSRPINAYDFNFSAQFSYGTGSSVNSVNFNVPQGYRAVPREWRVLLTVPTAPSSGSFNQISFTSNNAAVPNNQNIIFANSGTDDEPIKTFFLCEEQTQFGATLALLNSSVPGYAVVTVYGNLIAVDSHGLPFAIANETKQLGQ